MCVRGSDGTANASRSTTEDPNDHGTVTGCQRGLLSNKKTER